MVDRALFVLTFIAALGSGLAAGMFYAFSTGIMQALGKLAPAQGIAAMQSINIAVINPWFLGAIFGTGALCVVLAIVALLAWQPGAAYALAGSGVYLLGAIVVTMAINVPLNDALAAADPVSTDGARLWARYLTDWTWWNHVRSAAALAAAGLLVMALVARAAA